MPMAPFVLVDGAWHGGWCWTRVRDRLAAAGHRVFTPTLTGLGARKHLLTRDVDLDTHITDVVNLLEAEELTDVVLVGHSYAGAVTPGVVDRAPQRVRPRPWPAGPAAGGGGARAVRRSGWRPRPGAARGGGGPRPPPRPPRPPGGGGGGGRRPRPYDDGAVRSYAACPRSSPASTRSIS